MLLYLLSMLMLVSQSCGGNKDLSSLLQYVAVAPFTGAWIETSRRCAAPSWATSPPSRGRGLKPCHVAHRVARLPSPPSRGRGLKLSDVRNLMASELVAPFTGAWIETGWVYFFLLQWIVAPFTGAWIETAPCARPQDANPWSPPSRGRGLKLR